jgi:phenylalanyl-tRNA synthetase beta chain
VRVSYKWLKDYVDIPVSPAELAERLTLAGIAVEGVHQQGAGIEKVYTGKILAIAPHPNADRLTICQVAAGGPDNLQIVTGATNISAGDAIPVAVEGARLAGGLVIKKSKLRGVESRGMLCSGQELGLDPKTLPAAQAHGIMILSPGTPPGLDIKTVIGLDDTILELDLTPNRGDAMSMVGVAREVAALLGQKLRLPEFEVEESGESIAGRVKIDIEDNELCRRYVAKLFTGIKTGPSPGWMQERLRAAGVRPISNIVDVTNYVMMELGQPLHAFDYDTLKDGHIIVRRALDEEVIVSLDGAQRRLSRDMLVISDPGGPVAVAGVMGGLATEVTENTTNVLLESAWFNPISIRKTSKMLGLRSEASSRYEKGIDLTGCLRAARRASRLLADMGAGVVAPGEVDSYPSPYVSKTIVLRPERVEHILGVPVSPESSEDILSSLEFGVLKNSDGLMVTVPGHRPDVSLEVDLIEEVARIYGYHRIPVTLPFGASTRGGRTSGQSLEVAVKDKMAAMGLREVITYSFVSPEVFNKVNLHPESTLRRVMSLQNPLSEEQSVMRTTMLPSLLEVLHRNANRKISNLSIFELGKVYLPGGGEGLSEERPVLAVAAMGRTNRGWNRPALEKDFYYMKGILETLLRQLGVAGILLEPVKDNPSYHPGRSAGIVADGVMLGMIGEVHPLVVDNYELPNRVMVMEIDFNTLAAVSGKSGKYRQLPRFPGIERDLAVVVSTEVPVGEIMSLIKKTGGHLLQEVNLFDVYRGEQVRQDCQSIAFSLTFRADDRTLTDEEAAGPLQAIQESLARKFEAQLRN